MTCSTPTASSGRRGPHLTAVLRAEDRVTPLELFFDLVFVLALTQCTALMADEPTWEGLGKGLLVLGDPVVGVGRLRVADQRRRPRGGRGPARDLRARWRRCSSSALCDPGGVRRLRRCCSPSPTRSCASRRSSLFVIASRDDPGLRQLGDGPGREHRARRRAAGRGASFADGGAAGRALGRSRSRSTSAGRTSSAPRAGSSSPSHFAERHGLIIIIALGRVDRRDRRRRRGAASTPGVVVAAVLGVFLAAALWWLYFDVVALVAARRLANAAPGPRAQRDRARLVLVPALPDGRRHRAARARAQEDARARRRRAADRARRRAAGRRRRSTCSRTSRSAGATSTASARSASSRPSCSLALTSRSRSRSRRWRRSALVAARARRPHRLRDRPLRRAARPPAPPARGAAGIRLVPVARPPGQGRIRWLSPNSCQR